MPNINIANIPYVTPGRLFDRLTSDNNFSVRWLVKDEPVHYESLNRVPADLAVRQLIVAKSIDSLNICVAKRALFPFIIAPTFSGHELPLGWIWDMSCSMPRRYIDLRLAYVVRVNGTNPGTPCGSSEEHSGTIRLVFCANREGYAQDFYMFSVDYDIGGANQYQRLRLNTDRSLVYPGLTDPTAYDEHIDEYLHGQITFRTLDTESVAVRNFYDQVAPSMVEGEELAYDVDAAPNDQFVPNGMSFGSGLITDVAYLITDNFTHYDKVWNESFSDPHLAVPTSAAMDFHRTDYVDETTSSNEDDELLIWSDADEAYRKIRKSHFGVGIGLQGVIVEEDGATKVTSARTLNFVGNVDVSTPSANKADIDIHGCSCSDITMSVGSSGDFGTLSEAIDWINGQCFCSTVSITINLLNSDSFTSPITLRAANCTVNINGDISSPPSSYLDLDFSGCSGINVFRGASLGIRGVNVNGGGSSDTIGLWSDRARLFVEKATISGFGTGASSNYGGHAVLDEVEISDCTYGFQSAGGSYLACSNCRASNCSQSGYASWYGSALHAQNSSAGVGEGETGFLCTSAHMALVGASAEGPGLSNDSWGYLCRFGGSMVANDALARSKAEDCKIGFLCDCNATINAQGSRTIVCDVGWKATNRAYILASGSSPSGNTTNYEPDPGPGTNQEFITH